MCLTSVMTSYNLPGLNVKILDKPLRGRILDENMGPIYGELRQTSACKK